MTVNSSVNSLSVALSLSWAVALLHADWLQPACAHDEDGGNWQLVAAPGRDGWIELPPLCVVQYEGPARGAWRQSGELAGGLDVARNDFRANLDKQGWSLDKIIPLGRAPRTAELHLWVRRERRLLVMLWEAGAGRCGFAVGEEPRNGDDAEGQPAVSGLEDAVNRYLWEENEPVGARPVRAAAAATTVLSVRISTKQGVASE